MDGEQEVTQQQENVGSYEERAKRMGWVNKDQFRGEKWVDAETYVRLAEESLPILKGTLKTMERKMAEQEKAIKTQTEEMLGLRQDMSEFVEFSKSAEKRAYDKALKDLKTQQIKAKEAGDLDAFAEATEQIDSLIADHPVLTGKEKPAPAAPEAKPKSMDEQYQDWMAAEPAVYDDWKQENKWIDEDPEMFSYAEQMDKFLHAKHGFTKPRSERLAEIAKLVKKKFPDYFGNPTRKTGSPVEGDSGGSPGGNGKKSYHDLPEDARKICDKWTGKSGDGKSGTIPGLTREQYVNDYFR